MGDISWRVVAQEDAVTHIPPLDFGWRHVGIEVWYNRGLQRYKVCPGPEEDPTCSLRKPGFKINGDHFGYFAHGDAFASARCGTGLEAYQDYVRSFLPHLVEALAFFVPMVEL